MSVNPNDPSLQQLLGGAGTLTQTGLPKGSGGWVPPVYGQYDFAQPTDPAMLAAIVQAIQEEAVIAGVPITPDEIQQWAQTAVSDPNLTQLWPDIANGTLSLASFSTYARDFIRQQYIPAIASSKSAKEYAQYGITDKTEETIFSPARSLWEKYFGREPTTAQLQDVIAHGTDPTQWEDYIRGMPSHIPGYAIGAYMDTRQIADQVSGDIYGHPSNDSIMADLLKNKAGSKADVQAYYDSYQFKPGQHVDASTYNKAYAANLPIAVGLTNDYPHPLEIRQQLQQMGRLNELTPTEQG